MDEPMKRCARCGTPRPATKEFFTRDDRTKDHFHAWCKECLNEIRREKRAKDKSLAKSVKLASKGLQIMEKLPEAGTLTKAFQSVTGMTNAQTAACASTAFWKDLTDDDFAGDILKNLILQMSQRHDINGYIDKYMKAVFDSRIPLPNEMNAALKLYFDVILKCSSFNKASIPQQPKSKEEREAKRAKILEQLKAKQEVQ